MNEQQTEQVATEQVAAEANGAAEPEINRGPFATAEEAQAAAKAANEATGKGNKYRVWQTTTPEGKVIFTTAIDQGRGLIAAAKGLGFKTSLVGGKAAKAITAEAVQNWLAGLPEEERAKYLAAFMPQQPAAEQPETEQPAPAKGGKGKRGKGKAADETAE